MSGLAGEVLSILVWHTVSNRERYIVLGEKRETTR